jgi:hypothetical protein
MRRLAVVLVALGLLLRAAPADAQSFSASDEARMFQRVNAARASHGVPPLVRSDALVTIARRHSSQMAAQHKLSHNSNIRGELEAMGVHASWTGENVVVSSNSDRAMEDFLASPDHYNNIVRSNYPAVGIGVLHVDDVVWVTQDFAEIRGGGAPAPAPRVTNAPAPVVATAPRPAAPPPPTPKPTLPPTPPSSTVAPNALEHGIVFDGVPAKP